MARRAAKRLSAGGREKKRDDEERQGGEKDGRVETVVGKSRELVFWGFFSPLAWVYKQCSTGAL